MSNITGAYLATSSKLMIVVLDLNCIWQLDLLKELFPTVQILEEVLVPITRNERAYFDFYINTLKLAVEVHGQQHYKFNSMFHSSAQDFANQRRKDMRKQDWCEYNNITYVELPYDEKVEEWKTRILQRND